MSIFGKQTERVIRTNWKSVQDLAEELYAIFSQNLDLTAGSITIEQPSGATDPPFQINTGGDGNGPIIQISHGDDTFTLSPGDFTGGSFNGGGGTGGSIDFGDITWPGQDPADHQNATPDPGNPPLSLYGEVVDQVSDNTYRVKVWAKSPLTAPPIGIINVRAPGLDPSDILPVGYQVMVLAFPGMVAGVKSIQDAVMCPPVYGPLA